MMALMKPAYELKRRQHHVWQHYLESRTVDRQIFCMREGKIFRTNTINVAVERDFYKLHRLNAADISLIKLLCIDGSHALAKRNNERLLNLLVGSAEFLEQNRSRFSDGEQLDRVLDAHRTNALENYYAGLESDFVPLLGDILSGDLGFYSSDAKCIQFFYFIAMQHMRTKGIREKAIERLRVHCGQDVSRIWNLVSAMFASTIGMTLFLDRKRRRLSFVQNHTEVQFVAGDQPLINLEADGQTSPIKLTIYYPVSPSAALLLSEVDEEPRYSTESLTAAQANDLNARIHEACHSQIFAQTPESLLALRRHSGN
jgi:hypothetical protein